MDEKELWNQYLKEQNVELDYFGRGKHRGYDVKSGGVRCDMSGRKLHSNYLYWCEKKLLAKGCE